MKAKQKQNCWLEKELLNQFRSDFLWAMAEDL